MPSLQGRILVVDDEPPNTRLLQNMLEAEYDIVTCHSGAEALNLIQSQRFDMVLLDLLMPGIEGMEVLRQTRELFNKFQLPIILVSGLTDADHVQRGLAAQANDYIFKPLRLGIVQARVRNQLDLKRLSDERDKTIELLEKVSFMRNRLLRIASHDLKAPLANLQMVMSLLETEPTDLESHAEILGIANMNIETMFNIVNDFLNLEILKNDAILIELAPVQTTKIVNDVLQTYQTAAEKKGIQFVGKLKDYQVLADARRLEQVIGNLISNAIKYSPPGSQVLLKVERDGDQVFIHVIDQGAGIPANEQDQLFEPFAKISTEPTDGESSTGLGLWIAQHMIQLQDGEIGLDRPEKGGCDFWVRMPIYEET